MRVLFFRLKRFRHSLSMNLDKPMRVYGFGMFTLCLA